MTVDESPELDKATSFGRGFAAPRRVAIVVNTDRGFITHRLTWALALAGGGSKIRVFAPDTGYGSRIQSLGLEFRNIDLGRENISPMRALWATVRLFVGLTLFRPQLVFLVQTAAYALGWPAALVLRKSRFVRVAGGVGRALSLHGAPPPRTLLTLLRLGSRLRNVQTLFQLQGDLERFLELGITVANRSDVVAGTGVDTDAWTPNGESRQGRPIVMFASRLYEEKGVREFVGVARQLQGADVRFVIVGEPDPGVSSAISRAELESWASEGLIEWWGHRDNMRHIYPQASLMVFPSRHPEGVPRTLVEALACGVPAVVSDQEGCRRVVENGRSGWVIDARDVDGMAALVRSLLTKPSLLEAASKAARDRAIEQFSFEAILTSIFSLVGISRVQVIS